MQDFKEKIRINIINKANAFKNIYIDYDYLIYSTEFNTNKYYILNIRDYNYLHLTGVKTNLKASEFFHKSLDGTLSIEDFWIEDSKHSKGTVRRKIRAMGKLTEQFDLTARFEEDFEKNQVRCSIASTDSKYTLGFDANEKFECKAKTLLDGDKTKNAKPALLILRKARLQDKFDEILVGGKSEIMYANEIKGLIAENLLY